MTILVLLVAGFTPAMSSVVQGPARETATHGDGNHIYRAVIIAVGEPRRDARTVDDLHNTLIAHGWQEDNIFRLLQEEATRSAILTEPIEWLHDQGEDSDDVTLFFFSLHGDQITDVAPLDEPDSLDEYVCPADYDPNDDTTFLLDDDLATAFENVQSHNLVAIFETCHSGGMLDGANDLCASGRVILTSCATDETSFPVYFNGRWLFPHYLVQGLQGPADTSQDGKISAEEAFQYAEQPTILRSTIVGFLLFLFTPTPLLVQHPQIYDAWPSEANNTACLDILAIEPGMANA
jgi:hypothetical protein